MAAAKTNYTNIIQALLSHGADVNVCRIFQVGLDHIQCILQLHTTQKAVAT